jgi:hypothetical protein
MSDENKLATTTPPEKKHWVRSFVEKAKGEIRTVPAESGVSPYATATGGVMRAFGESAITGGLLGTTRAMFGDKVADTAAGVGAGLGAALSVALAGTAPGLAQDIRQVGAAAMAVFSDRKAESFIGKKGPPAPAVQAAPAVDAGGANVAGEYDDGVDPVVAASERLKQRRR